MFARVLNTNSMDPVMDEDSIVISKKIKSLAEIKEGDIISFREPEGNIIIHRVYKKYDTYVVTKGDNNLSPDPYKITFSMMIDVVVGILY